MTAASIAPHTFDLPPLATNGEGLARSVGVEIEFGRLAPRVAAGILAETLGGRLLEDGAHAFRVEGTELGTLTVELDVRYAHPQKYGDTLPVNLGERSADWFGRSMGWAIPTELIFEPLAVERLPGVDRVVEILRAAGASGTADFGVRDFGLHFNAEAPRLDAATATAVLKAFLLLEDWLRIAVLERRSRYLPGMPPPFPPAYVRKVVAPDYRPEMPELIGDYLASNATRKRSLDLLPLFMLLDEARIRAALPWEKIRKRPVFHYRLPLARIERPNWSVAPDWNRWVAVERLAADAERLERLGTDYLAFTGTPVDWAARVAPSVP